MAAANPNGFDHFRCGEPVLQLQGAAIGGFDHFRNGEPLASAADESGSGEAGVARGRILLMGVG